MRLQKITAFFLALILFACSAPAGLAAPQREMRGMDLDVTEGMQALADILAAALMEEEATGYILEDGSAPAQALGERVLSAAGLRRRPTTFLTWAEAEELYRQVFSAGAFMPGEAPAAEGLSFRQDGVVLTGEADSACGAYIYALRRDGGDVIADCDFYVSDVTVQGSDEIAFLPEDAVLWRRGAEITLEEKADGEFGYTVKAVSLTPLYESGCTALWREWEDAEQGYSLRLPESFLPGDEAGVWRTAEDEAAVQVKAGLSDRSFDETAQEFALAHPDCLITPDRAFSRLEALGEKEYCLTLLMEETGGVYELTLRFPAERWAEFAFYAEMIRNSFIVWEIANG